MNEYALCFIEHEGSVLLIEKAKPEWQRGKINLPGGSIEKDETPEMAAARELFEEADILSFHVFPIGVIQGQKFRVHVIGHVSHHPETWNQKTNEPVFWLPTRDALAHPKLIPNLKLIIPLCSMGVRGWTLTDPDSVPGDYFKVWL
jgi:8-oxo-dGTP pyrophosphatase MutT (NUDIX family)